MSVDNRTIINDCEATDGWSGDDGVSTDTAAGAFYQDATALTWQAGVNSEQMSTTEDSVGATTFDLDWADVTLYFLVKDNLGEGFSTGGIQSVIGDGTDLIGYNVGGNDAVGLPLPTFFNCFKLDVSVVVDTPGSFTAHAGTEANLAHGNITEVGIGVNHLVDAMGPSDNTTIDCIRFIANDSYALTVNGGTSGTPETMTDVVADDVTNGWGMVSNPLGSQYLFFAPTEWGNETTIAEHAFVAANEQWYWIGDNGGGHATGAGHFIFRVTANSTDAGLFRLTNVVVVNTGTGADFDCSDTDIDILEIDLCSFEGLASFSSPSTGGTSRFVTNTTFRACGTITHNGASMNGCSVNESEVATLSGAVFYNETADPNGETDDMSFVRHATTLHHAMEFGTSAPQTMTLTNWTVTDFSASDGDDDSVLLIPDTGGDVTWTINHVGTTGTMSFKQLRPGDTVNVTATVPITVTAKFGAVAVEGARVRVEETDGTLIVEGTTNSSGVFSDSVNYGGDLAVNVVVRLKGFQFFDAVDTITSTGLSVAAPMSADPTVNLP